MVDTVVLAGGAARRLQGRDKVLLTVDGTTLLDVAVAAAPPGGSVVVVGPPRPTARPVRWVREDPPLGGPAAALAAGVAALAEDPAGLVLVLAADLPRAPALATALLLAAPTADARVVVDADGRPQWTAALLRAAPLRAAIAAAGPTAGLPLHRVVGILDWEPVEVAATDVVDVDTPEDADRLTDLRTDRSTP